MTDRSPLDRFADPDGAASDTVARYGSWPSPVGLDLVAAGFVRLSETRWDGGAITWLEGRADDDGRQTLVRWTREGGVRDVSPAGINVRTRVHEYGGAAYLAAGDLVVISDFATGRLLRVGPDPTATPLTGSGADRGGAARERHPPRLPPVRGRRPWVPQGVLGGSDRSRPSSRSTAPHSGSSRPTRCRRCHWW